MTISNIPVSNILTPILYLDHPEWNVDDLWLRSFRKFCQELGTVPLEDPRDEFSVDFNQCWSSEECSQETYWIPGFRRDQSDPMAADLKPTGKRTLRAISMLLADTQVQLRGKKIVNICPNPYCCNPAHLLVVSNRSQIVDHIRTGVEDEEWEAIRIEINNLRSLQEAERLNIQFSKEMYNGGFKLRQQFESTLLRDNPHALLTDDDILIMAIQRKTSVNTKLNIGFESYLERYQLKTAYQTAGTATKAAVEFLLDIGRLTEGYGTEDYTSRMVECAAVAFREENLLQQMQQKGLRS